MPFTQIAEMIKTQWARIGIQADVAELERSLLNGARCGQRVRSRGMLSRRDGPVSLKRLASGRSASWDAP